MQCLVDILYILLCLIHMFVSFEMNTFVHKIIHIVVCSAYTRYKIEDNLYNVHAMNIEEL